MVTMSVTHNKKLVLIVLILHFGYIRSKTINLANKCSELAEEDPRWKRSDENVTDSGEDTMSLDDLPVRNIISKEKQNEYEAIFTENNDGTKYKQNEYEIDYNRHGNDSSEYLSESNDETKELPLIEIDKQISETIKKEDNVVNYINECKNCSTQQPVIYQPIDPKYIWTSGLYKPQSNDEGDLNEGKTADLINIAQESAAVANNVYIEKSNLTVIYDNETNDTIVENKEDRNINDTRRTEIFENGTDLTNIRELREHLLDHLLDYFLNIIKEEQNTNHDSRKNNKATMKLEERLRNYYDPHHIDSFLIEHHTDSDENDMDLYLRRKYGDHYTDEENIDNRENITDIESTDNSKTNTNNTYVLHSKKKLNLDEKQNGSFPDYKSLYVDFTELFPEISKHNKKMDVIKQEDSTEYSFSKNNEEYDYLTTVSDEEVITDSTPFDFYFETTEIPLTTNKIQKITTRKDHSSYLNGTTTDQTTFIGEDSQDIIDYTYDDTYNEYNGTDNNYTIINEYDETENMSDHFKENGRKNEAIVDEIPQTTIIGNFDRIIGGIVPNDKTVTKNYEIYYDSDSTDSSSDENTKYPVIEYVVKINKNDLLKKNKTSLKRTKLNGGYKKKGNKCVKNNKLNRKKCKKNFVFNFNINII